MEDCYLLRLLVITDCFICIKSSVITRKHASQTMSNDTLFVFDSESNNSLEFMQNCWHEEDVIPLNTPYIIPRLHDTPVVKPAAKPVWTNSHCSFNTVVKPGLTTVLEEQLFVQPGCTAGLRTGCIHGTAGCQTDCQTGLTTGWMLVYTIQPVVKTVYNRFDNRLYRVNGVKSSATAEVADRGVAKTHHLLGRYPFPQ